MNIDPTAILAVISDLAARLVVAEARVAELEAERAHVNPDPVAAPPEG